MHFCLLHTPVLYLDRVNFELSDAGSNGATERAEWQVEQWPG